jgi:predicted DNA-binding transcriptional regulator YafY
VAAARSADDPEMAGWRRLTMTMPYPDEAPGRMLSVGPHLEVLEPPEVRRQIAVLAHRIAERYRDADPVDNGR